MPLGTDVVNRDGDLAVGLLAQLAAILVLDADGVLALLGVPRIVDHKDPLGTGEGLSHHRSVTMEYFLLVPGTLVDELLHGLFGIVDVAEFRREWNTFHHGLDALALAILDQTTKVDTTPRALGGVPEVVTEMVGIIPKPFQDFGRELWCEGFVHTIHTNKGAERFRII
jgi:hypothetical protein